MTPGQYEGRLTVTAEGLEPTAVPVRIRVLDWTLPDPKDFVTHLGVIQSPDSVALWYKVPLWSERHFRLMEQSFKLLAQLGNKTVYLPIIRRTNLGNSEGMVRWIRQGDGYRHDFAVAERYLDLACRYLKPGIVCLYLFDHESGGDRQWRYKNVGFKWPGTPISLLDPTTGKVGEGFAPRLDTGHFVIYKRAPLAVTSGCYSAARGPSGRHGCYHQLAISSNLIMVKDPDERPFKIGWMLRDQPLPNDGGQRWTAGKFASGTPWSAAQFEKLGVHKTSKVLAFQPGKEFTYVCGDLTPAYTDRHSGTNRTGARSKRVRRFLRTLLFLPPDHLVLFDQVESFNKDFQKSWVLHTVNPPKIDGATTVVEHANLVFRSWGYPNWSWDRNLKYAVRASEDHPFFRECPDCKWIKSSQPQLYQYDGVMYVHTLLPEKARLTTIGGPGKEFWVDGQNYGTATMTRPTEQTQANPFRPKPHEITGEAGSWRVEVRPATARENDLFLHVVQVGIKSKAPRPTPAKLIEAATGTGVEVGLADGRKATVVFKPGVGGHVNIERNGQVLLDEDLAEEVLPNLPIQK